MLVATILGILASLILPQIQRIRERSQVAAAVGTVDAIGWDIIDYELENGTLPNSLAAVGRGGTLDPWGNPYQYLRIRGSSASRGAMRKDRFLVPINSDFDLYSMGADEKSSSALTAKVSHDDIVRANDGGFVGLGSQY